MLQQKYVQFYNIMYIFIHSREYLVSFAQYNSLHIPLSSLYFSPYPSSANRYVIPFSTIIFANLFSLIVKSFLPGALHPDLHLFTISNNLFSPQSSCYLSLITYCTQATKKSNHAFSKST